MSRSHHYRNPSSTDDVSFIVIILLAGSLWTHKALITKVEHYALLTCAVGGVVFVATIMYKVLKKLLSLHHRVNPNMSDINTMSGTLSNT
jgi:hypothetical protein